MNTKKTIRSALLTLALVAVVAGLPVGSSAADPYSLVVQTEVKGSVQDVIKTLSKMVADNGMMVMGELHQGKVLEMTGYKGESESIFVGNPTMGKKLFSADPGAGLVVPVRINVFSNGDGKTVVSYIPPSRLLGDFGNSELTRMAGMLDKSLGSMTGMLPR